MTPEPKTHAAIEDAGGNLNAHETSSIPPTSTAYKAMQTVLRERQLDDRSRLVWKPLPSHSRYEDDPGRYFDYSKSTAKILRHGHMHAKDGSVPSQKYANAMYGMMLKAGSHGQFTRDTQTNGCGRRTATCYGTLE